MTVQPTEQWVQMLFRRVTSISGSTGPASAFFTVASGKAPKAAMPPAAKPELRRKLRRSIWPAALTAAVRVDAREERWAEPARLFTSIGRFSPSKPVQRVELLHMLGFLIAGLDPLLALSAASAPVTASGTATAAAVPAKPTAFRKSRRSTGSGLLLIRCHIHSSLCSLKRASRPDFASTRQETKVAPSKALETNGEERCLRLSGRHIH